MKHVLVTGASGVLGQQLLGHLVGAGHAVWAMSRRAVANDETTDVAWVQADLASGAGLASAVAGVDTIVHAASHVGRGTEQVDVAGTQRLLEHARAAGVRHVVYVSIVGIERIPVAYYRHKLAAEQIIAQSGIAWSIQRSTQFHHLVDMMLRQASRLPVLPLPTDFQAQPIDPADVARRLCTVVASGPAGRLPDYGGPEVLTLGELARTWLGARGLRRPVLHLPFPGLAAHALRRGENCCPDQRVGVITWASWLKDTEDVARGVPNR